MSGWYYNENKEIYECYSQNKRIATMENKWWKSFVSMWKVKLNGKI